ncbi:hypothetical protein BO71DRAFT_219089 [Aspergillus ellipticus CBS 707.79]|uniref:Uncharacterized protein n=1 Tax=Aspergillus ellipticus CBS 707.79 TaxID=1448320 RepID=A0A319E2X9_9EURO|nr:hypothetical protein BO71DRAFT_219089 [Aspergillus ellipticus CBS 707.79]
MHCIRRAIHRRIILEIIIKIIPHDNGARSSDVRGFNSEIYLIMEHLLQHALPDNLEFLSNSCQHHPQFLVARPQHRKMLIKPRILGEIHNSSDILERHGTHALGTSTIVMLVVVQDQQTPELVDSADEARALSRRQDRRSLPEPPPSYRFFGVRETYCWLNPATTFSMARAFRVICRMSWSVRGVSGGAPPWSARRIRACRRQGIARWLSV